MQSRMLLAVFATKAHCWIIFSSLFTQVYFCQLLSRRLSSNLFGAQGFPHQVQDFAYPLLYFMKLLSVSFSSLLRSIECQHNNVVCINNAPSFPPCANLWRAHIPQSPISVMKMLNSISQLLTAEDPHEWLAPWLHFVLLRATN